MANTRVETNGTSWSRHQFRFGIIARRKAGEYISRKGHSPARISVGKGLGKAGIIAGIAMSVFWFLYFILFVVIWGANFYYLF